LTVRQQPFPWILIFLFVVIALNYIVFSLLASRLRRACPSIWDQLGRPAGHPRFAYRVSQAWQHWIAELNLQIFVWRRQYVELCDGLVSMWIWLSRAAQLLIPLWMAMAVFLAVENSGHR
jgi:hypothetical protein